MRNIIQNKNKKGISELVGYVLLIVIALGLATGVYAWVKHYLPSQNEYNCPSDTALTIKKYSCDNKVITLEIQNSGFFNVNGFFLRVSNDSTKQPTIGLASNNTLSIQGQGSIPGIEGRYEFSATQEFIVGTSGEFNFIYPAMNTIEKLQIQPYQIVNKKLYLCENIATIDLENCT